MSLPPDRLLASTPVWRRLSPADRALLGGIARVVEFPKGARVFEEGEPSDFFVTIASGRVKIVKSTPAGKDVILEIFATGDPLGAVASYDGRPFPATAVALEPTTCLMVPRREFFALLEQHPSLVRGLLSGLTLRLVELTNRIVDLNGVRVEPRFARPSYGLGDIGSHPLCLPVVILPDFRIKRPIFAQLSLVKSRRRLRATLLY